MMFKDILRGFTKFFSTQRVIILVVFLILAWGLLTYSGSKTMVLDKMEDGSSTQVPTKPSPAPGPAPEIKPSGYALQPVANPSDLLPVDKNSQWAALNPNTMNQGDVMMPDLLQAGYHIGLDTIGQTLRNANLQLRSDPLINKADIGPWNQSTIEPDIGRVPLEIGEGSK